MNKINKLVYLVVKKRLLIKNIKRLRENYKNAKNN